MFFLPPTERAIIIKKTVMKKIKIPDIEREKNIPIPIKTEIDPRTMDFCRRSWLNHNTFSFIDSPFFMLILDGRKTIDHRQKTRDN